MEKKPRRSQDGVYDQLVWEAKNAIEELKSFIEGTGDKPMDKAMLSMLTLRIFDDRVEEIRSFVVGGYKDDIAKSLDYLKEVTLNCLDMRP